MDSIAAQDSSAPAMSIGTELPLVIPPTGLWYVAHTKARNEKALAQDLSRWGIPCYLPLANRQTKSRRTGRISRSQVPVFPGYVFFAATEEQRYQSLTTNRIAKLLIVPEQQQLMAELQRIQHLLAADEAFSTVERLEAGDWGRITAGPLTGLEGIVLPSGGRWRLSMSVTILGQSVQVEVDREHVERIDPPTWSTQPAARSAGF